MRLSSWVACGLLLALPGAGSAEGLAKSHLPKVMVVDLTADKSFRPTTLRAMNDFLAGAIHDQGFRVLTHDDLRAAMGLDQQKKLLGCEDSQCLAEIGGALGADYIVRGNVAVLDRQTAITLALVDTRGQSINQQRELVDDASASDLVRTVESMVPRLMRPVRRAQAQPAVAAGGLTQSTAPVEHRGPGAGTYALLGGGITGVLAGGVLGVLSLSSYHAANQAAAAGGNFQGPAGTAVTEGRIGLPLLVLGTAAIVTGALVWAGSTDAITQPAQEAP